MQKRLLMITLTILCALTIMGTVSADNSTNTTSTTNLSINTTNSSQTMPDPQIWRDGAPVSRNGQPAGYNWVTIQNAIDAAQDGDTIMLENGATFSGTGNTQINISKNLIFDVLDGGTATIDGEGTRWGFGISPGYTVIFNHIIFKNLSNPSSSVGGGAIKNSGNLTINSCTFTGTKTGYSGGAIWNNGTLTVTGSTFINSTAAQSGGAIYSDYTGGNLIVTGSTFTNNTAGSGSAIYSIGVTSTVDGCTFTNNAATYSGGAICNYISNNKGNLTVTGSTFTNNTATGTTIDSGYGGAINNHNILTVNNCTFTGNKATGKYGTGGAIYNNGGSTTVNGSTFTNNTATRIGGAIYSTIYSNEGNLSVNGSTFTNNTATRNGGAIYNTGSNLTVNGCTFTNNTATYIYGFGGAIYNEYGNLTVNSSTFTGNTVNYVAGAIYSYNSGNLTVTGSTFTGNSAQYGGAICNELCTLTVTGSTFTDNTASYAGAIYNAGGTLIVNGSTLTGNNAGYGGAIYNDSGDLNVAGSTFTGNNANNGGAIFNFNAVVTITGSTFANNTASYGGAIYNTAQSFNAVATITGSTFTENSVTNGGGVIYNDNMFGGTATATLNFNRIVNNTASYNGNAIYCPGGSVNATLNWWGSNNGPVGTDIYFSGAGTVTYDPWIVLTITANPTTIANGGTSQLTADLLHDSNSIYHDPALGHVPDIPVTLTIPWGSFENPAITHSITEDTVEGIITAIFYANEGSTPSPNPVPVTAAADGYTTNNTESAYITINRVANISITKTSPATVIAGNQFTYIITITNSGPDPAEGVTLDDSITNESAFRAGTLQYRYKTNDGTWSNWFDFSGPLHLDLGTILNGMTAVIEINGTVNSSTPKNTVITNTATANTTTTPNPKVATATTTVDTQTNLVVSKTGPTSVAAGNQITYTITVTNNGPSDAQNVVIQDIVPAILQNVTHDSFNLGTIGAGQSKTVTITGTVPANTALGTVIENSATVTSDTSGTITPSGTVTTTVNMQSNLNVVKESLVSHVAAGVTYTDPIYRITVTNNGPSDAQNVQIQDNIPSQIVNREYRVNGGAWISFTGSLDQLISYLAPGASIVIEVRGRIPSSTPAGSMSNTASASVYGTTFNSNTVNTAIVTSADVDLNKTVDKPRPNVGDTVTFTVTVHNYGPGDATNIQISDLMPSGFADVTINPSKGTYAGGIWTLDLASGEEATLTLSGKVTPIMAGITTTNTATKLSQTEQDSDTTDSASASIYVPKSDLYIKITSDKNNPKIGETFTITYKLGNNGPDAADNVTITIPLPEGFEYTNIHGDGKWTYNAATRAITWTFKNVPVGDPYLYISGEFIKSGSYVFGSSISSETYNINTVTPITVNAVQNVKAHAASKTIPLQHTGLPIAGLVLAILAVLGGLSMPKRKN